MLRMVRARLVIEIKSSFQALTNNLTAGIS